MIENLERVKIDDFKNWPVEEQLCFFIDVIDELSTKCYDAVDHRGGYIFSALSDKGETLNKRLAIFVDRVDDDLNELEERKVYPYERRYITEEDLTKDVKNLLNHLFYTFNTLQEDMKRFNHDEETQSIVDDIEKFDKFVDVIPLLY
jgi:hypothetical protein